MTAHAYAWLSAIRGIAGPVSAVGAARSRPHGWSACALRPFFVVVLASALLAASGGARAGVSDLRAMARAGAPGLALSLMDEAQPAARADREAWARWERARIAILTEARAWQRALDRLRQRPDAAPASFRRWARERRAAYHLQLGSAAPAARLLRGLLWHDGPAAAPDDRERWRRLVIRAHLVAGRVDDAVIALRRFDQDYHDRSPAWVTLRTRVLLRADRAEEAAASLPEDRDGEMAVLATLARGRTGLLDSERTYRRSVDAATAEQTAPVAAARWWFVAADTAARQGALGRRALATERVLGASALPPADVLFALDGDDLWAAWLAFGRRVGNDEQLLIGDDDAWFAAAEAALPQAPVRARALLAVVAQEGSPEARARAHTDLLAELDERGPGMAVARRAYLGANRRYPTLTTIPEGVRYRLVDDALARNDLDLAGRLLSGLSEAPADVDDFGWHLLRARVLVRGDRYEQGAAAVGRLIESHPRLRGDRLDRLLQVIFDLQGAGEHERALVLLERLTRPDLPTRRRRELLYWRAESHDGLEQYREAAAVYMRSALVTDDPDAEPGADPWGQTARYQAAGMLARAGLVSDARRIYRILLRTTQDEDRRATLRHRLRQLPADGAASGDLPASRERAR